MRRMNNKTYRVKCTRKTVVYKNVSADSEENAKQEALRALALGGWIRVYDEELVEEVERVYATRIDCRIEPERVRQAA